MAEERRVTATGTGKIKKKSPVNRFVQNFVQEDAEDISNKIADGLANAVKRVISDTVETILWGDVNSRPSISSAGRIGTTLISYNSMFDNAKKKKTLMLEEKTFNPREIGQIIVPSKAEAEKCIAQMLDIEDKYGNVRVPDLYDYFGEAAPQTMISYGWHDFASTKVKPLTDGNWLIVPPMLELLQTK